jgi:ABC-type transporter Mla subunit MlaD
MNPLFWLGLSILLVAASLTAVLVAAIPALQELARAARSAEKLFDTLSRELPPTLNAIRNTSLEITDLTDDVSEGVKSASQVVKQADQSLDSARKQAQNIQASTRSVLVGIKTAWRTFTRPKTNRHSNIERLPMNDQPRLTLREREILRQENRRTEQETYRNKNG